MSQAMPTSASFQSDCALVSRYAAARGLAEPTPEVDQSTSPFGMSSSPNTLFSSSTNNHPGSNTRPSPEMVSTIPARANSGHKWGEEGQNDSHANWRAAMDQQREVSEATPLLSSKKPGHSSVDSDWWTELRTIGRYTLPVFGTHLLEYSLSIAPVISIGHISTNALAAVTLGTMTASVTGFSIIIGFVTALDTMLPSAWTSGTPSLVGLWTLRMGVLMTFIMMPIFLLWINAESILLMLRQDPEIAHLAGVYLLWFSLGLPAYAANSILRRYFQSQGLFSAPTRVLFIVAPINILLNYLLVWGPEKIRLGFIGAPIATAISFNLTTFFYVIYGLWFVPRVAWHPLTWDCLNGLGFLFKLGLAGVFQVAAEWWSWELVALAASQIGPLELAVQSILLTSASTSYQAPYALSAATSVRVGNQLGSRNAKGAALATRVAVFMALIIALVLSAIFMIFREKWAYMFNSDPDVVQEVAHILPLVALFQIFDGLGAITGAILRAKGQQDVGAVLSFLGYYVVGIPFGLILAFRGGLGLEGLWIGLTVALVIVGLTGLYLCTIRTNWDVEVEKAMIRLGYHDVPSEDSTRSSTVVA